MNEILNTENDVQVPVVAAPSAEEQNGGTEVQNTEFTDRVQSRQENASFRKMRLENERLREENERLKGDAIERKMEEDLLMIRALDPSVSSLEELGEDYAGLIASGVSARVAFEAVRAAQRAARPATFGALAGGSSGEKTYYSPADVDSLSAEELADDSVWARVRESMTRWG